MSQIQEELQEVEVDTTDTSFRGIGHAVLFLLSAYLGTGLILHHLIVQL